MKDARTLYDPQIGEIILEKTTRSRRLSVRIHPLRGVRVSVPVTVSYDEAYAFCLLKKDRILNVISRQKRELEQSEVEGKAITGLGNGTVVRTLLSEIRFERTDGPESGKIEIDTKLIEDVKKTGRLYLDINKPVMLKSVKYSGCVYEEDTKELFAMLSGILTGILRTEAKIILPRKISLLAERFGFGFGKLFIKHNLSNWGSCSIRSNINLNLNLVRLPEALCDYVLLHELCHLKYYDHGANFHRLLEKMLYDNLKCQLRTGAPYVKEYLQMNEDSKQKWPLQKKMQSELKAYRLI